MTGRQRHEPLRIVIDADRCEANAICVQVAPGLFAIGAGDIAVASDDGLSGETDDGIDGDRLARAEEAVRQCPTHAIRISTE